MTSIASVPTARTGGAGRAGNGSVRIIRYTYAKTTRNRDTTPPTGTAADCGKYSPHQSGVEETASVVT